MPLLNVSVFVFILSSIVVLLLAEMPQVSELVGVFHTVQLFLANTANNGAGIVGVVEADFLDPIHNKQEFDKTDRYKWVHT